MIKNQIKKFLNIISQVKQYILGLNKKQAVILKRRLYKIKFSRTCFIKKAEIRLLTYIPIFIFNAIFLVINLNILIRLISFDFNFYSPKLSLFTLMLGLVLYFFKKHLPLLYYKYVLILNIIKKKLVLYKTIDFELTRLYGGSILFQIILTLFIFSIQNDFFMYSTPEFLIYFPNTGYSYLSVFWVLQNFCFLLTLSALLALKNKDLIFIYAWFTLLSTSYAYGMFVDHGVVCAFKIIQHDYSIVGYTGTRIIDYLVLYDISCLTSVFFCDEC